MRYLLEDGADIAASRSKRSPDSLNIVKLFEGYG
jgi:hypothetical protein